MNELVDATIKEQMVKVEKTDRSNLVVSTTIQFGDKETKLSLTLREMTEIDKFEKLMEYTKSNEVSQLVGKNIRVVCTKGIIRAFGHPTEDKFVYLEDTEECKEYTWEELDSIVV